MSMKKTIIPNDMSKYQYLFSRKEDIEVNKTTIIITTLLRPSEGVDIESVVRCIRNLISARYHLLQHEAHYDLYQQFKEDGNLTSYNYYDDAESYEEIINETTQDLAILACTEQTGSQYDSSSNYFNKLNDILDKLEWFDDRMDHIIVRDFFNEQESKETNVVE